MNTPVKHKNVALVHVHVYYVDMWDELAACLENICIPFKLFVTLTREDLDLRRIICTKYPEAHVSIVANLGYDIAPFIDILNRVNLDDYTFVIKLHSKRDINRLCYLNGVDVSGSKWRDALLSFIKTPQEFMLALSYMQRHHKVGAVARDLLIIKKYAEENANFAADIDQFVRDQGWQCCDYSFVAGTMFMMRAHLLKPLQNRWTIDDFEDPEPDSYQQAHRLERILGYCVYRGGYVIHDWRIRPAKRIMRVISIIWRFLYYSKNTRSGRKLIKICKVPVWWGKI